MKKLRQEGFTLVELAVVLVIISLLVSGIMAGEEVLETSKRTAVISTLGKYKSSYDQFSEKYYSIPGDIPDAEDVWGAANTDNGDGNGYVDSATESYLAWQHLGLSGFVDGRYPGSRSGTNVAPSTDIPSGPYTKSGYQILQKNDKTTSSTNYNAVTFAKVRSVDNLDNPVLVPKQAKTVDQKIDDSNPSEGQIVSITGGDSGDVSYDEADCIVVNTATDLDIFLYINVFV